MSEPTYAELVAAYEVLKRHVNLWGEYAEEKRHWEEKMQAVEDERKYKLFHWTDEPLCETEILEMMSREDSQRTVEKILYLIWKKNITDYNVLLKECAAISPIAFAICSVWRHRWMQECEDRVNFGDQYLDAICDEFELDTELKIKINEELLGISSENR